MIKKILFSFICFFCTVGFIYSYEDFLRPNNIKDKYFNFYNYDDYQNDANYSKDDLRNIKNLYNLIEKKKYDKIFDFLLKLPNKEKYFDNLKFVRDSVKCMINSKELEVTKSIYVKDEQEILDGIFELYRQIVNMLNNQKHDNLRIAFEEYFLYKSISDINFLSYAHYFIDNSFDNTQIDNTLLFIDYEAYGLIGSYFDFFNNKDVADQYYTTQADILIMSNNNKNKEAIIYYKKYGDDFLLIEKLNNILSSLQDKNIKQQYYFIIEELVAVYNKLSNTKKINDTYKKAFDFAMKTDDEENILKYGNLLNLKDVDIYKELSDFYIKKENKNDEKFIKYYIKTGKNENEAYFKLGQRELLSDDFNESNYFKYFQKSGMSNTEIYKFIANYLYNLFDSDEDKENVLSGLKKVDNSLILNAYGSTFKYLASANIIMYVTVRLAKAKEYFEIIDNKKMVDNTNELLDFYNNLNDAKIKELINKN